MWIIEFLLEDFVSSLLSNKRLWNNWKSFITNYYISGNTENNKATFLGKHSSSATSGESSDSIEMAAHKFWNHTFTIMNNNGLEFNNNDMEDVIHYNDKSEQK